MDSTQKQGSLTLHNHRRQFFLQILIPFLIMAGLIIAGAVVVTTGGSKQTGVWADVSIIWLLAPMLVFALLIVMVLGFLIYGFAKITHIIPHYTGRAREIAVAFSAWTRKMADGAAQPILWYRQAGAAIKSFIRKI
jgi:hypothetical protein